MSMIAVFNPKGGVGKTSLAVNLAWCAAQLSSRRSLLWDCDAQGGAGFLLGHAGQGPIRAKALFEGRTDILSAPEATAIARLDLIAADPTLNHLDRILFELGKKKRLAKMTAQLDAAYERIFIDCPAGQGALADQILRAADLVILPVVPAPLAQRTLRQSMSWFAAKAEKQVLLLPVWSMVDPRKPLHRDMLATQPDWPVVPLSNLVERMGQKRMPLGSFAPNSPAQHSVARIWRAIERKLTGRSKSG